MSACGVGLAKLARRFLNVRSGMTQRLPPMDGDQIGHMKPKIMDRRSDRPECALVPGAVC